jgi:hypothetical protein
VTCCEKYESSEKGEMAMTKVLRIFTLLMVVSMLLWIAGCGGDDDDDECADNVAPTVTLNPNGGDIGSNTVITATFNKTVDTVTATGAAPVAVAADNKVWTFSLGVGDGQSVTVEGTDTCGETGSAVASFNVGAPDTTAPTLDKAGSTPPDGADVDPAGVAEIVLKFSEPLASAELTNFEPEAQVQAVLDGDTVTVEFLGGFTLSNEQTIVVELTVKDGAANESAITYSFTTMKKEE